MAKRTVLAIDLGAESGRVMAVHFDGAHLSFDEVHRFANTPVLAHGTLHWDILRLWHEIQTGIDKSRSLKPASLGVDTWGVDFALLDSAGELLGSPVHYRDPRTNGVMERALEHVPRSEIFAETGIQFMPINTLYQLYSLVERSAPQLAAAATFLTVPDLINYWLTGQKVCEYSIATTTQMLNARTADWSCDMLARLSIPTDMLPPIVHPGTRLGDFEGIPVIAPACHDTQSAVAALSASETGSAYISSGTWSLIGVEIPEPILTDMALSANVTNEGGVDHTICLLANATGLWLLQQCRAVWKEHGLDYSYAELVELARKVSPQSSLIDTNDPCFLPSGDHPALIQAYCRETGQQVPATHGEIVRCVVESLALKYRQVLDTLRDLTGKDLTSVNIVGGGSQNALLNQLTADATGLPVTAGPVEATVLGNALVQFVALGEFRDISEARAAVRNLGEVQHYEPHTTAAWAEAYERYQQL